MSVQPSHLVLKRRASDDGVHLNEVDIHAIQAPNWRTHDAQLKVAVIAARRVPGASVAAVALAHDLNANLVRKWLVDRGLKRCGLRNPPTAGVPTEAATPPAQAAPALQFVPVQLPPPASPGAGEGGPRRR